MTYRTKIFLCLLFFILPATIAAQNTPDNAVNISYANDFFTGTDRYFTQGIRLELIAKSFRKTPVRLLGAALRKNSSAAYYSVALQQDGFTPTSIQRDTLLNHDRPFCGSLFITNSEYILFEKRKLMLHSQLSLGAIGPLALGFEEQTAIHKAINNVLPRGWKNEIQNDLILNYQLAVQKALLVKKLLDMSVLSEMRLGTMFTDASAGINIRTGIKSKWGNIIWQKNERKWQLFAFVSARIKAVAYNATLQGGLLNRSSVYTISGGDMQRLLLMTEFGISASYKNIQTLYTQSYLSKEFSNGLPHQWGKVSLAIGF